MGSLSYRRFHRHNFLCTPISLNPLSFFASFIMSTQTMSRTNNANTVFEESDTTNYTLLDGNCAPHDGYFLQVTQWVNANNNEGCVTYVDADGNKDEMKFTFDHETRVFKTHHVRAPMHIFDITPVIEEDVVVELRMDLGNNDVGRFVLHPEDYIQWYEKQLITFCDFEAVAF